MLKRFQNAQTIQEQTDHFKGLFMCLLNSITQASHLHKIRVLALQGKARFEVSISISLWSHIEEYSRHWEKSALNCMHSQMKVGTQMRHIEAMKKCKKD